jgi:hypothetical protein
VKRFVISVAAAAGGLAACTSGGGREAPTVPAGTEMTRSVAPSELHITGTATSTGSVSASVGGASRTTIRCQKTSGRS